jgi:hypothetical protein
MMKKQTRLLVTFFSIPFLGVSLLTGVTLARAQAQSFTVNANQALCLPDGSTPRNACLLAGPAQRLNELSALGITFPAAPLPLVKPPYSLFKIPFSYALLDNAEIPTYASLGDALANTPNGSLPKSHLKYLSYISRENTDKGIYYQSSDGNWLNGEYVKKVSVPYFQGYLVKDAIEGSFGWVLQDAPSYGEPGYTAEKTGRNYHRLDMVHIYDTRLVDNMEWEMIAPGEWIEHRFIARVTPNTTPPAGVTTGRWIEVNLYEQTLMVYENQKLIFATLVATGSKPFYTKPGTFQIYKRLENDVMYGTFEADHSDYYRLEDVPYIMYYDEARALHGAYWNSFLGYPGSHGCVNLSVADAHWLFDWAKDGDWVYVWDPSGKTPTDPSYYGPGGA